MRLISLFFILLTVFVHAEKRPNIIFILTDDQRLDSIPLYGNDFVKTPHLDQLGKESIVFDNASVTSAICTPSRACYFLGQYERMHSINFNSGTSMAPEAWEKSYPVVLKKSGYYTGYVGKNHVPIGANGYETGLMDKSFDFWYAGHGHIKFYPKKIHEIFKGAKADTQIEIISEATGSFLGKGTFLEGAQAFLKKRPQEQPFCLSICLNLPHGAGTSSMKMLPTDPELYRTLYRDQMDQIKLPQTYVAKKDIKGSKLPQDVLYTKFRQDIYDYVDTPATLRERMVRQYQTITGIDMMLGSIRKKLEEIGEADNTIIIFTSDHGLLLGEQGLGGKSLNYETCLRVPLIIHDPRVPKERKGVRTDALVQSVDIAPTILELADVASPSTVQGESLVSLINGDVEKVREFSFAENLWSNVFGNPRCESVKNQRYKYIRYFKNEREPWAKKVSGEENIYSITPAMVKMYQEWRSSSVKGEKPVYEELYDLKEDPYETKNLINEKGHQVVLNLLRHQCQAQVTMYCGDYTGAPATLPLNLEAKTR